MNAQPVGLVGDSRQSRPLSSLQFAMLFAFALIPFFVTMFADIARLNIDLKYSLIHWTRPICYSAVIAMPFYLNGGGFARLAFIRAFASANTPLVLFGLLPTAFSIALAMVQLHGSEKIWLEYNPINFMYDHAVRSYSARLWYFSWGLPLIGAIAFSWLTILILSLSDARARLIGLAATQTFLLALAMISSRLTHVTDSKFHSTRVLHSSNTAFFVVDNLVFLIMVIALYMILEKAFRPSLLAMTAYLSSTFAIGCFLERPTDLYGIVAHVLPVLIIWLFLRNSKWSSEKWADYQQRHEALQT